MLDDVTSTADIPSSSPEESKKKKAKRGKEEESDVLMPLRDPISRRSFLVFDLESKDQDSQAPGFERPFLACVYDGVQYHTFRDSLKARTDAETGLLRSYTTGYWHEPGGCVDRFMRHVLGLRACEECDIKDGEDKWGGCSDCILFRQRYQSKNWIVIAHNGGNFDNLFVLGWARRHASLFENNEIISVQSRMLIFTLKPKNAPGKTKNEKWSFGDSVALLPIQLVELGKAFCANDPDFQKMNFDLKIDEEAESWEVYNRRDCAVLLKGLDRFRTLVEKLGGAIGATAASTAMQLFRRKFLKKPIQRSRHFKDCDGRCRRTECKINACREAKISETKCHACMHDFIRDSYFGGRSEIFRTNGQNLFYADINSSYPTAMLGDMPVGHAREMPEGLSIVDLRMLGQQYIGFVECIIEVPKKTYLPVLPHRLIKSSGEMKLVFPTGRLYGTWDWIEIEAAMKAGAKVIAVGKSVWYQKAKVFTKMINVLYGYRQKICKKCNGDISKNQCPCPGPKTWDAGLDYVAKLMMNSLYGKFATNPIREKTIFSDSDNQVSQRADIIMPSWVQDYYDVEQHVLEVNYIIPQIASHITAIARLTLYYGLMSVLRRGGHINYTDTDSCMATLPVLPMGSALGQWKLEDKNLSGEFLLPKTYMIINHADECTKEMQKTCPGCLIVHKKVCKDSEGLKRSKEECELDNPWGCDGTKVKMKGVPQRVQNVANFNILRRGIERLRLERVERELRLLKEQAAKQKAGSETKKKSNNPIYRGPRCADCREPLLLVGELQLASSYPTESNGRKPSPFCSVCDTRKIKFDRLTKHRTMLRRNLDSPILDRDLFRSLQSEYDKRVILPDGNTKALHVWCAGKTLEEARAAKARGDLYECETCGKKTETPPTCVKCTKLAPAKKSDKYPQWTPSKS